MVRFPSLGSSTTPTYSPTNSACSTNKQAEDIKERVSCLKDKISELVPQYQADLKQIVQSSKWTTGLFGPSLADQMCSLLISKNSCFAEGMGELEILSKAEYRKVRAEFDQTAKDIKLQLKKELAAATAAAKSGRTAQQAEVEARLAFELSRQEDDVLAAEARAEAGPAY